MATEELLQASAASVVEDVLQQHGKRLFDIDLASRKAEEASMRRNEAAEWLRKTVGVVAGKDLPAEPSEDKFLQGLRSGHILCNALNRVQPGTVQKVIEMPSDSAIVPDGGALVAYQYFENVRNFLVAIEEMGLPTFQASDLELGGNTARVVNCVLALKAQSEYRHGAGPGLRRYGNVKGTPPLGKQFVLKNSPFMNSVSRSLSMSDKFLERSTSEPLLYNDVGSECGDMDPSLRTVIRGLLADKKQEEIPIIVENMLSKVMEEFEQRLTVQNVQTKSQSANESLTKLSGSNSSGNWQTEAPTSIESPAKSLPAEMEIRTPPPVNDKSCNVQGDIGNNNLDPQLEGEKLLDKKQDKEIQMIKTKIRTPSAINEENHGETAWRDWWKAQIERQLLVVGKQHGEIQALKSAMLSTKVDLNSLQKQYNEEVENLGTHLRSLSRAASGYQTVLEENRKLYNQVQDLKGSIRVYCRIRPAKGKANGSVVEHLEEGTLTLTIPSKNGKDGKKSFTFNRAFGPSARQEEVFSDTQPLIRSVLDGFNVCIFAYGQTGSGKTHTMTGPDVITPETMGVNYRALSDLFKISEERKETIRYEVSVQMIEIYNEQVRDLLTTDGSNKRLEIRNSSQNGLNVPDANVVPVHSTEDVINLMTLGHKNRAVGSTAVNDRSSRSHSCLTVHVQGKDLPSGSAARGCLHLVDLAGSERVEKTEATGDRLKEAQHINKSLSALGDVISSLAQKNAHVPYRNSKLTQLLQESLGGQAKTLMFVHISPELDAIGETISTLKFAERVSSVELGAAKANKDTSEVKDLKEQIASLKAALAKKDGSISPERPRLKTSLSSAGSSPSRYSWQSMSTTGDQRQQMEEIDNLEIKSSSLKPRRKSLDPQDLLNLPRWEGVGTPESKDNKKYSVSGDWVDKIMVNKLEFDRRDSLGSVEDDGRNLPDVFYQKLSGRVMDDSDELDTTTSDSSEQDLLYQSNIPQKVTNTPNGVGSKLRKPSPRQTKSADSRSSIPAPSRRLSNSGIPKMGKQQHSADGKRKPLK